jgi:hypothetical protein
MLGHGHERDKTGAGYELRSSGIRFWTLMWGLKHHAGQVDPTMAQLRMSGFRANDRDARKRIPLAQDETGTWRLWGEVRGCSPGEGVGLATRRSRC